MRNEVLDITKERSDLESPLLNEINGGAGGDMAIGTRRENPDSDCPYKGNWLSSEGFVCEGEVQC